MAIRLDDASARTTLDVYGHLWPDDEEPIRVAVEDELGAALAGTASDGDRSPVISGHERVTSGSRPPSRG